MAFTTTALGVRAANSPTTPPSQASQAVVLSIGKEQRGEPLFTNVKTAPVVYKKARFSLQALGSQFQEVNEEYLTLKSEVEKKHQVQLSLLQKISQKAKSIQTFSETGKKIVERYAPLREKITALEQDVSSSEEIIRESQILSDPEEREWVQEAFTTDLLTNKIALETLVNTRKKLDEEMSAIEKSLSLEEQERGRLEQELTVCRSNLETLKRRLEEKTNKTHVLHKKITKVTGILNKIPSNYDSQKRERFVDVTGAEELNKETRSESSSSSSSSSSKEQVFAGDIANSSSSSSSSSGQQQTLSSSTKPTAAQSSSTATSPFSSRETEVVGIEDPSSPSETSETGALQDKMATVTRTRILNKIPSNYNSQKRGRDVAAPRQWELNKETRWESSSSSSSLPSKEQAAAGDVLPSDTSDLMIRKSLQRSSKSRKELFVQKHLQEFTLLTKIYKDGTLLYYGRKKATFKSIQVNTGKVQIIVEGSEEVISVDYDSVFLCPEIGKEYLVKEYGEKEEYCPAIINSAELTHDNPVPSLSFEVSWTTFGEPERLCKRTLFSILPITELEAEKLSLRCRKNVALRGNIYFLQTSTPVPSN